MANIISEALLRAVIARKPKDEDIVTFLPRELARLSDVMDRLHKIQIGRLKAKAEYAKAVSELTRCERMVQEECPHYQHTYHPNPSCDVDSITTCDLCGKELDRREPCPGYDG